MATEVEKRSVGFEVWDFFKKNFAILLIGVAFLFFYFRGCDGKGKGTLTSDTTTVTRQVEQPIIIMPPYQPQQSGNTVFPINIPPQYNASTDLIKLTEQYNELVKQYLAMKTYEDSIQLRDTAGRNVGTVTLKQGVSENTLKYTQPSYQLRFPETIRTITNTVTPPPKNQVYVGLSAETLINKANINSVGAGLLFKNKKDVIFGVTGIYNLPQKSPGVQLSLYKKIKL